MTKANVDLEKEKEESLINKLREMFKEELKSIKCMLNSVVDENKRLKKENEENKIEISILKEQVKSSQRVANDLEAYSRRNSVRILGVADHKEEKNGECQEKIVEIFKKLELNLNDRSLDAFHRIGFFKTGRPRPIIVKFVRRVDRDAVLKNKKKLKGSDIFIHEDLTSENHHLLKCAKDHPLVDSAWSFNGRINVRMVNGNYRVLKAGCDLNEQLEHEKHEKPAFNNKPMRVTANNGQRSVDLEYQSTSDAAIESPGSQFLSNKSKGKGKGKGKGKSSKQRSPAINPSSTSATDSQDCSLFTPQSQQPSTSKIHSWELRSQRGASWIQHNTNRKMNMN